MNTAARVHMRLACDTKPGRAPPISPAAAARPPTPAPRKPPPALAHGQRSPKTPETPNTNHPTTTTGPKVLLRLIRPYTRVRLPFLAARLNAPMEEVERLLVSLVLDGRVEGRIDQVRGRGWGLGCFFLD